METFDPTPAHLKEWVRLVGKERAQRAQKLVEQGVTGSLPELLTYDWLERQGHSFLYQVPMMSGRLRVGGAVVDFLIFDLQPGIVIWRSMGRYWHGSSTAMETDRAQKERLLGQWFSGTPVVQVVDLWEDDIYTNYPDVFLAAEAGVSLR